MLLNRWMMSENILSILISIVKLSRLVSTLFFCFSKIFFQLQENFGEKSSPTHSNPVRANQSGASSPDEWKVVGPKETRKPPSFSDMAKKPGNPGPSAVVKRVPFPEKTIAQTNRPHCYFKIQVDNETPFRVVFELRPDMAPKMVKNFVELCKGLDDGRGYQGSRIFRAKANDHILGGDFENDDGTGGRSAYDEKYFLAEQCPLKVVRQTAV